MTKTRRDILKYTAALGGLLLAPSVLRAQAQYPSRTIRIIVPFPAGATTDMLARLFAQRMTETMGQSVVIENVGGGGGSIGADQVAKATPDGHTLLFGNITFTTTTASLLYAKRARHDFDDFIPVSVGAGEERAVARKGKIEAAWIMTVTLSTDHRAVDGALGSELIGAFKALIENPVMMVV